MTMLKQAELGSGVAPKSLPDLQRQLRPLFRQYGVVRAAVFGSFARGEQTAKSDLDLLVKFKSGKSMFDLVGLKLAIEETTERRVDVATDSSLHPRLRAQILSEAIPIYETKRSALPRRHPGKHRTRRVLRAGTN